MSLNSIVQCDTQDVFLDTGLSPSAFAKSRHSDAMKENGVICRVKKSDNRQIAGVIKIPQYDFEDFYFDSSEVKVIDEKSSVFFKGTGFRGITLTDILEKGKCSACLAILFVCAAIIQNISSSRQSIKSAIGAGGIILGTTKSNALTGDVLFLPPTLFDEAALMQKDEIYSLLQGRFVNKALSDNKSLQFLLAVLSYRGITNVFPYPAENTEERELDFLDSAFVPINLVINGIDNSLAFEIDARLNTPQGDYSAEFPIEKVLREMGLEASPTATDGYVSAVCVPVSHKKMLNEKSFELKKKRALSLQKRQIKLRRFFRRYNTTVGIAAVVIVLAGGILASYLHDRSREITTQGLTSAETVRAFYTGLDNTDVTIIQNTTTGEADRNFSDVVAGIYVTAKTRVSYDQNADTKPLDEWLFFNNNMRYWIYGISRFELDGVAESSQFAAPQKYTKPKPITEENGIALSEGAETSHKVSYYMVYNSSEDVLNVVKTTDTVNLVYKKNKWLVSAVKSTGEQLEVDQKDFKATVAETAKECGDDVLLLAEKLHEKYEWIPREDEMLEAATNLYLSYSLKSAKAALEKAKNEY